MLRRIVSEERGQALIIMALAMVVLVGFLALAIDGGNAYAQRRLMQNAADAAALAGVRALALGENAEAAATEYAVDRNGADSAEVIIETGDGQTVTVVARKSFPTFFASVLGWFTLSTSVQATATYGSPAQMPDQGFFPIAIKCASFEAGKEYEIWDDGKEPDDPPEYVIVGGNRGWLNFNSSAVGASELKQWVREGYATTITIGDWINGDPGTRASALQEAEQYRIGDTVIMAGYDGVRDGQNGSGQLDYQVACFAAFKITSVDDTSNPKKVVGRFKQQYIIAGPQGGVEDDGIVVIGLTQ